AVSSGRDVPGACGVPARAGEGGGPCRSVGFVVPGGTARGGGRHRGEPGTAAEGRPWGLGAAASARSRICAVGGPVRGAVAAVGGRAAGIVRWRRRTGGAQGSGHGIRFSRRGGGGFRHALGRGLISPKGGGSPAMACVHWRVLIEPRSTSPARARRAIRRASSGTKSVARPLNRVSGRCGRRQPPQRRCG